MAARQSWALLVIMFAATAHGQWTMFRGTDRSGVSSAVGLPLRWSRDDNIAWCVKLQGSGNGSPVVSSQRVVVNCAQDRGQIRGTYCYDTASGRLVWAQTVRYEPEDPTHGTNPYCGSTPAIADGRVVVWHGSAGIHCYDLTDGRPLWSRDLGEFRHIWGYGSSPIVHSGRVYLNAGPGPRQCLVALRLDDGAPVWRVELPGGMVGDEPAEGGQQPWTGSWATPLVACVDGADQLIVPLPERVAGFDLASGTELWTCRGLGPLVYTDLLVAGEIGVAMGGYHGPAFGFRLGGHGDTTATHRLWHATSKNPQRIGSGVVVGQSVFIANEVGLVQCIDLQTGAERWREPVRHGKNWSSLVAVDGRLYYSTQQGTTVVLAPNPERLEILAENQLGEGTNATLAPADGHFYHRTFEHLWSVGPPATARPN